MKTVILAGGIGSRISEESYLRPKPMIEIGGKPILWHIMKIYSYYGINEFIICLGYKGYIIKEYFANYFFHMSDVTFDLTENKYTVHHKKVEPWQITLVDTGENTATGGRLKRVSHYLNDGEPFCFTYGDGVSNVNIQQEIDFHVNHGKLGTICAVQPPGRYGSLLCEDSKVISFEEKPIGDGNWINGGFFILDPKVITYIADDSTSWESEPISLLVEENQLRAYKHAGFWQPMDTLREKKMLDDLYNSGKAPWKIW